MVDNDIFHTIVNHTPLISIDFIVKDKDERILLGKRRNKPAQGFYFTLGGRIYKNETISNALKRIAVMELGIELKEEPKFIGVFEHFYQDSIFDETSTHYINFGYEVKFSSLQNPPKEQHMEYQWFQLDELLQSNTVHTYVKDYFKGNKR